MKKFAIVSLLASSIFLVGCGEDKTPDQVQYERQKEMLAMKQAHEREMARIDAKKIGAANPTSHTYVENEYDQRSYQEENSYGQANQTYATQERSNSGVNYADSGYSSSGTGQGQQIPQAQPSGDEGFGAGSMALAALGGAAAGYLAGEMLNNGMKSYKGDDGRTHYTDKNGRPVSQADYDNYKKQNPKTTAFREKVADTKARTGQVIDNTKSRVANSSTVQGVKQNMTDNKNNIQQSKQYQNTQQKVYSAQDKLGNKVNSRIPPAQQKATSSQTKPVQKKTGGFGSSKPKRR